MKRPKYEPEALKREIKRREKERDYFLMIVKRHEKEIERLKQYLKEAEKDRNAD